MPPESPALNRRFFIKTAGLGLAALAATDFSSPAKAAARGTSRHFFDVKKVKRTAVRVPFREVPKRAMDRELPHWRFFEIFEVTLGSGQTGIGETLLYYTWGRTNDTAVRRAIGKNALDLIWDDSLGAGLQISLFDAVARTAGVPVHRLLGRQVNQTTPLSWWNIDTSAADMATECQLAHETGYLSYKTKGRPWFDIYEQLEQSAAVVPPEFKIDMDFNATLLTAEKGMKIIKDLEKYPQVDIYETPIPQADIAGNRKLCDATHVNIALHYGTPKPHEVVEHKCGDGFVVGGGASKTTTAGRFSEEAGLPFWLQLVGSGITAAYSLHFGGVLQNATWPAVNCHQLYTHNLLTKPITVTQGHAHVPDTPGLGYELDRDTINRFKIDPTKKRPEPERLLETVFADGSRMYVANDGGVNFMLRPAMAGNMPFYKKGADTKLLPDDGSPRWRRLYEAARKGPIYR